MIPSCRKIWLFQIKLRVVPEDLSLTSTWIGSCPSTTGMTGISPSRKSLLSSLDRIVSAGFGPNAGVLMIDDKQSALGMKRLAMQAEAQLLSYGHS